MWLLLHSLAGLDMEKEVGDRLLISHSMNHQLLLMMGVGLGDADL